MLFRPSLHSNPIKKYTKPQLPLSVAVTSNTSSVSLPSFQVKSNKTPRGEKSHNITSIMILPPPGFKPPVINHCSRQFPEHDTTNAYSVLSGTMSDTVPTSCPSISQRISVSDFAGQTTGIPASINLSLAHATHPGKSAASHLSNIYTFSGLNSRPICSSLNASSALCLYAENSHTTSSMGLISTEQPYSLISQIHSTVPLTKAELAISSDKEADQENSFINASSNNTFDSNNRVTSTEATNGDISKNPFVSPNDDYEAINGFANPSRGSLSNMTSTYQISINAAPTKAKNARSDQIKIVRFADTNTFMPNTHHKLLPKQANLSLPDLTKKSKHYLNESSSEDSDFDLSASYTSLNPFSPKSMSYCNQFSQISKTQSDCNLELTKAINPSPQLPDSLNTHLVDSKSNTLFRNKHPSKNVVPEHGSLTNSLNINTCNAIENNLGSCYSYYNNPFYQNKFAPVVNLTKDGSTASELGEEFFACLSKTAPIKLIENNTDKETVIFSVDPVNALYSDTLNKNESSVYDNVWKFNTTNDLDFFPPSMTTSLTRTTVLYKTLGLNVNSRIPTSMSDSNADGEISKIPFPNSSQTGKTKEQLGAIEAKEAKDRYAALKDLDDIFKSTVMCEGTLNILQEFGSAERELY